MTKYEMTQHIEEESGLVKPTYDEALKLKEGDKVFPNTKNMRAEGEREWGDEFHRYPIHEIDNLTLTVIWDVFNRKCVHVRWNSVYITKELREELRNR